jgi:hypothetical protein
MVLPKDINSYLTRRYHNVGSPGSFTSASKLHQTIKQEGRYHIPLKRIEEWAQSQDLLSLHKQVRQRQPKYRRVISPGIGHLHDADLLVLNGKRFTEANKGIGYILIVIDTFSRYCWAEPVRTKGLNDVAGAFEKIFKAISDGEHGEHKIPRFVRMDRGTEFTNAEVRRVFRERKIRYYYTNSETKANFAERVIKSYKNRLFRYFQYSRSYSYLDALPLITASYNRTPHTSIGMSPEQVNSENEEKTWDYQYVTNAGGYMKAFKKALSSAKHAKRKSVFKYKTGQKVRVAYFRRKNFDRSYDQQFTAEVYTVRKRMVTDGVPVYYLKNYAGENVDGTFYSSEITPVKFDPDALFKIDKVLKSRVKDGVEEKYVQYEGWPSTYNEWIAASRVKNLKKRK